MRFRSLVIGAETMHHKTEPAIDFRESFPGRNLDWDAIPMVELAVAPAHHYQVRMQRTPLTPPLKVSWLPLGSSED